MDIWGASKSSPGRHEYPHSRIEAVHLEYQLPRKPLCLCSSENQVTTSYQWEDPTYGKTFDLKMTTPIGLSYQLLVKTLYSMIFAHCCV